MQYLLLAINSVLIGNLILSKFLGICPFLGVSRKVSTALGMSMAVLFVMALASTVTWVLFYTLLKPFGLEYMRTIVFILVIASLVQLVEMVIQKVSPVLYEALGIYLPLITTNCAILGVAIDTIEKGYNFIGMLVYAIFGAIGFAIALLLFAGIRERLETSDVPEAFKGAASSLIVAGILSLAFMGFSGLVPG
ncbi:electron transport complex subunit RsxA [Myxococcota bacterium]|nr:electron transport complex subunit RsxA [Myxococcota bacterium]MBU1380522.1 electron transport complex subunit RsxA [Myxococcota bacterium]MBU1497293.1 electron transport complex subunit RsxA [Myxococcota bacterium]